MKLLDDKCGISQRKAARKMKFSQFLLNWELKNKTSIRKREKTKIPKRIAAPKAKYRLICRMTATLFKILTGLYP